MKKNSARLIDQTLFSTLATTPLLHMKGCWHSIVLLLVAFLFVSHVAQAQALLTPSPPSPPPSPQVSPPIASKLTLTDHPLAGKIWDTKQKKWVTEVVLQQAAFNHTYILLGETHDNHEHHRRHLQVLKWLTTNKQKPALVMEQFDIEHQMAINEAIAQGKNADGIADAGKLNRRGWQWSQYQPLVEAALSNNAPVIAANLSRVDARNVFAKGFSAIPVYALPANLAPQLFDATWNSERQALVVATMVASHCGQLPAERAPGMVNAQRARDAVMAHSMLMHQKTGAVLIAGRGHVRHDIGVPLYLKERDARAKIISIGFVEVSLDKNNPDAYAELNPAEASLLPFDYVWFSARQDRKDPCEGMTLGTPLGTIVAPAPSASTAITTTPATSTTTSPTTSTTTRK